MFFQNLDTTPSRKYLFLLFLKWGELFGYLNKKNVAKVMLLHLQGYFIKGNTTSISFSLETITLASTYYVGVKPKLHGEVTRRCSSQKLKLKSQPADIINLQIWELSKPTDDSSLQISSCLSLWWVKQRQAIPANPYPNYAFRSITNVIAFFFQTL